MKYFTPELLEQFRSEDEKTAESASDQWETQVEHYGQYLRSVKAQLPSQFRELLDHYCLHDAKVGATGTIGQYFLLSLRLDTPPQDTLWLTYGLVDNFTVNHHRTSAPDDVPVEWLYDEVEVHHDKTRYLFFPQTSFRHSILLSNGWELQIGFRNFSFSRVEPVRSNNQVLVSGTCAVVAAVA